MLIFTPEEEAILLTDCGFVRGIDFESVPEDLRRRLLTLMHQWRWERNQREFENRHSVRRPEDCGLFGADQNSGEPATQSEHVSMFGLELRRTCGACPEQYDVYQGDRQVGYLRLRHGCFRVDVPSCGGRTVFQTTDVMGDGVFHESERERMLRIACQAILQSCG